MKKVFEKPKTLFQQKLNEIMTEDPSEKLIKDLIHIQMHKNAEKDEKMLILVEIYNVLGLENFVKLIDLIDGRQTKFPSREEFKDTVYTAICFYYKNFKGYNWNKIEDLLNSTDIKTIKMNTKINQLSDFMKKRIEALKEEYENKNLEEN